MTASSCHDKRNVTSRGWVADPIFADECDLDATRELVDSTDRGELFTHPGDVHLFADSSLPSYDQASSKL